MILCRLLPLVSVGNEGFGCCLVKVSITPCSGLLQGWNVGLGFCLSLCWSCLHTYSKIAFIFVCLVLQKLVLKEQEKA